MAGVKFPSSFDVTGRFPLDSKFWVASVTNLFDGEIYAGLHRWTLDTGKEYVYQKNNTWKDVSNGDKGDAGTVTIGYVTTGPEAAVVNRGTTSDAILDITIPKGDAGSTPIIDIGTTTAGNTPSVTNVGTSDRAILNFVIPASAPGVNGVDGKSIWFAYASDVNGLNPSYSSLNKNFISIASAYLQPDINTFNSWIQIKGNDGLKGTSAFIAYSSFSNGSGASFTLSTVHKYISIIVALTQPPLTDFTTWVLFKGLDGGPAGDSAYQTWLKLGNNGSEALFISSLAGATGLSAYQVWLALGNVGTQQQFINSLAVDTNLFASKTYVDSADGVLRTSIDTNTTNIATNANILTTKVDKVTGFGLSTNDYTTADKIRLAGILPVIAGTNIILDTTTTPGSRIINAVVPQTLPFYAITGSTIDNTNLTATFNTKVDKVAGLALSSNDYTSPEKTKLAAITTATTTSVGLVKIGNGITVAADGTISAAGGPTGVSQSYVDNADTNLQIQITSNTDSITTKSSISSPSFTGIPLAPTAIAGTSTTQIANTQFVTTGLNTKFNNRDAWVANTLYQPNDTVSSYGTIYYYTGDAFTSGAYFDPTNWVAFGPELYDDTGQNMDGVMTQKATTDALSARFNNRGAWTANTLYQANDAVSYNGATYYRTGAAFTSSEAFVVANWNAFGPWQVVGNANRNNISLGPLSASVTFAGTFEANLFGAQIGNCSFGDRLYGNVFGAYFYGSTVGIYHAYNVWGIDCGNNNVGDRVQYCTFGDASIGITIGSDCNNLTIGEQCGFISIGANCKRVQIYNCRGVYGTTPAPFIIPAGTTDAVYRNNLLVTAPTAAPLYAATGQATDGAMTQKATTDALANKTYYTDALARSAVMPAFTGGNNTGISFAYSSVTNKISAIVSTQIPYLLPYVAFGADFSISNSYAGSLFGSESNTSTQCFINPDTAAAILVFPLNAYVQIQKTGTGNVTIVGAVDGANPAPNITVAPGSSLVLTQVNERRTLYKTGPNQWLVLGIAAANNGSSSYTAGTGIAISASNVISSTTSGVTQTYVDSADTALRTQITSNTAALAAKLTNRGAWNSTSFYNPNDLVTNGGGSYYNNTNATITAEATFNPNEWTAFGVTPATVNPTIEQRLTNYSLLKLPNETVFIEPASTANRSFSPVSNTGYYFDSGGTVTMNPPKQVINGIYGYGSFTGGIVSIRLKEYNTVPLTLLAKGENGYTEIYVIAPGETIQLTYHTRDSNIYTVPYLNGPLSWILIARSGGAGGDSLSVIDPAPFSGAVVVDFESATVCTINSTQSTLAYGASLNIIRGSSVQSSVIKTREHYIKNSSGSDVALSFPTGWTFFPGPAPTKLAAGKQAILTVRSLGTSDASVKAAWVAQT